MSLKTAKNTQGGNLNETGSHARRDRHACPYESDLRLRAYGDFELMEAAIRVGARAIVIKTHQGTTVDRAYLCNRHNEIVHGNTNNFTMYGSITLNRVVAGSIRKPSIPHFVLEQKLSGSRHSPQNPHAENGPGSEASAWKS